MKRFTRAVSLLLLLSLLLAALPVAVFAADPMDGNGIVEENPDAELSRAARINKMGYSFPEEDDDIIPKYKLIYPADEETGEVTEVVRTIATDMADDVKAAPSGTTIVLLSDIYQSTSYLEDVLWQPREGENVSSESYIDRKNDFVGVSYEAAGKQINFDFAGHTVFSEYKINFFNVTGARAELNVYSSLPGAKLMVLDEGTNKGGSILGVYGGAVANIGNYGDYPGSNISTYTAGGITMASSCILNVTGLNIYRVATDHVAFLNISGKYSTAVYDGVRFFGIGRHIQIATREDNNDNGVYGNSITFKNSYISNVGSESVVSGSFFRYMADDNEIHFENTVLDKVTFTCDRYYEHEDAVTYDEYGNEVPALPNVTASITFDKYCSYSTLPDVKNMLNKANSSSVYAMFHFPELEEGYGEKDSGVAEYIYTDGVINNVYSFSMPDNSVMTELNESGNIPDFTLLDVTAAEEAVGRYIAGMYMLPYKGYKEDVVEVIWNYKGQTSAPYLWLKSEVEESQPIAYKIKTANGMEIKVPNDTEHAKYVAELMYSQDGMYYYTINPHLEADFKFNLRFADKMYVNVYIPAIEGMELRYLVNKISIAGNVYKVAEILENFELVTIGDGQYYKVVAPVAYDRITDVVNVSVDVANNLGNASEFSVSAKIDIATVLAPLLDAGSDAEFKKNVADALYSIYKSVATEATIPKVAELAKARLADRIAADKAKEEADKKGSGLFGGLFG